MLAPRAVTLLATALVLGVWLAGAGLAAAQLRGDTRSSTEGTQFVRPAPAQEPAPPPPSAQAPPAPVEPPPVPTAIAPPPVPAPRPARYPSVVFLVDTSDSMLNRIAPGAERTQLDEAKDALAHVLERMDAETRVQVWSFNTHMQPHPPRGVPEGRFVRIGQGTHRMALIEQVRTLHTSGGTNLYQSVVKALALFAEPRDQTAYRSGQRFPVLVVVSDGEDSGKTPQTLTSVQIETARLPLVAVHTIGFRLAGDRAWFDVLCDIATRREGCATADDETQLRAMLESFYRPRNGP